VQILDALNLEADPHFAGAKMSEWVIVKKAKPGGFHRMRAHFMSLYAVRQTTWGFFFFKMFFVFL
jgi:hypothetical protein